MANQGHSAQIFGTHCCLVHQNISLLNIKFSLLSLILNILYIPIRLDQLKGSGESTFV